MSEHNDHFDIDEDFLAEHEELPDYDPALERAERRSKPASNPKRGKAAWSRLEDVLAERRLEKELSEFYEE